VDPLRGKHDTVDTFTAIRNSLIMTKHPRKSAKRTRRPPPYAEELVYELSAKERARRRAKTASRSQMDAELARHAKKIARYAENVFARQAGRRAAGVGLVRRWEAEYRERRARAGIPLAPGAAPTPNAHELWSFAHLITTEPHVLADPVRATAAAPLIFFLASDYLMRMRKPPGPRLSPDDTGRLVEHLRGPGVSQAAARRRVAQLTGKSEENVIQAHRRFMAKEGTNK
jgi:hypothetical protein